KESNLPSEGLPRRHGFEDRMGHQTRAAPPASLNFGRAGWDWPRSALRIRQRRRRAGQRRAAGGSVLGERRGGRRLERVHVLDEVQLRPRFEAGEPLEVLGAVELQHGRRYARYVAEATV